MSESTTGIITTGENIIDRVAATLSDNPPPVATDVTDNADNNTLVPIATTAAPPANYLVDPTGFADLFPHALHPNELCAAINDLASTADITTRAQMLIFLAQCSWESARFAQLEENLNYSAPALLRVFSTHFNLTEAADYAHQPEKIANRVYANRYGNGNEASGDGWRYHGRGAIGLTFKDNYANYAHDRTSTLTLAVNYLTTNRGAIDAAIWFWQKHMLAHYTERADMTTVTRIVNGGETSVPQRLAEYDRIAAALPQ